jgi:RNA polymerase sigma-70 factor (ECF subfamily)
MKTKAAHQELEALYRRRFHDFLRIARSITGDAGLAHDAVQEAFVRALRGLRGFRGDAPLEAWIWRIVINAARDARPTANVDLAGAGPETPEQASVNGSHLDFVSWIGALPERQRLAVFLRYGADLDYETIAAALGVEVGTVSATLHAAREALKQSMEVAR